MKKALTPVFLLIFLQIAHTQPVFRLIEPGRSAALYHAGHEKVIDTALEMLASDSRLLGGRPLVITDKITDNTVIVGIPGNEPALDALITKYKLDISDIEGKWEAYKMHVVRDRNNSYLFILGSDPRGAAYG
ncbi:MAG: hypothetical protein LBK12_07435, partial [Odoribacteraceae bacterium]|nr:hypothetical protein [Odoribacteraceae bacterium]